MQLCLQEAGSGIAPPIEPVEAMASAVPEALVSSAETALTASPAAVQTALIGKEACSDTAESCCSAPLLCSADVQRQTLPTEEASLQDAC